MGLIIYKKKKERTPEQIKRRFYFAIGLVSFMVIFCMIAKMRSSGEGEDMVLKAMDAQVETAVQEALPGAVIEEKSASYASTKPISEEEIELAAQKEFNEVQLALSYDPSAAVYIKDLPSVLQTRIDALEKKIDSLRKATPDVYCRRLVLSVGDTVRYNATQYTDADLRASVVNNIKPVREGIDEAALQDSLKAMAEENGL